MSLIPRKSTPKQELWTRRLEVEREWIKLHRRDALMPTKQAMLAQALKRTGRDAVWLEQLHATFLSDRFGANARAAIRYASRRINKAGNWLSVPRDLSRLQYLFEAKGEALIEFNLVGINLPDAYCLAIRIADESAFGSCEDPEGHEKRLKELAAERDRLDKEIASTPIAPTELDVSELDASGRALVRLKIAPVPIAPVENLGTRVASYMLAQERN